MDVPLTPEQENYVDEQVRNGSFRTASEVIGAALRLLQVQDREKLARLDALRSDVQLGHAQLSCGEGSVGANVFLRMRQERQLRRED